MNPPLQRIGFAIGAALFSITAFAGRPLAVDNASVNDAGKGHVEAWTARAPGSATYNVAPAYAPIDGLELGALLARDIRAKTTLRGLQAKWLISHSQERGCNSGAVLGWQHESGTPHTASLTGLVTCNFAQRGSVHLNLGRAKQGGEAANWTWGMAYERDLKGVTPNIEWFGAHGAKPTVQAGLRGNIARDLQLDGSVGRRSGATLYTVGTKLQF